MMKNTVSRLALFGVDIFSIFISIALAYMFRGLFQEWIDVPLTMEISFYTGYLLIYAVVVVTFFSEKIYKNRFDFWEETRLVLRGLSIALVLILSVLALTKSVEQYSRFVIVFSFVFMGIVIPLMKNITKKLLFRWGVWKREAEVYGDDIWIKEEIFSNPYLGYVCAEHSHAQTVFIDTNGITAEELQKHLDESLKERKEVLFIPFLQSYNLSSANIVELTNARKNLVVLENALLKSSNIWIKKISDLFLSLLVLPLLVLLFGIIIFLIKKEEPKGSIFFSQMRMGRNGEEFLCYKFRSMREGGNATLEAYLKEHPDEIAYYETFHKYKSDPRITKIGNILRRTSLDELPQIINVFKGEMSLIGPRPYMLDEKEKIGNKLDMILAVKPGITGLWQVSGRSDVDFVSRVDMDVWYTRNWNLWLDLVILVKTIKVVLFQDGAH